MVFTCRLYAFWLVVGLVSFLGQGIASGAEVALGPVLVDGAGENRRLVDAVIERTVAQAEAAHAKLRPAMSTRWTWEVARPRLQQRLRAALGLDPWPQRTPLKAQILGETIKNGYKVQRLTFESRPGFVVTANVYVPRSPAPAQRGKGSGRESAAPRYPAVLCPVGHWPLSKAQPQVQARCIGLAKLGFIALTYDPFGQGERAVEGNSHAEYFRTILAGRNNISYMLWDTMRALDYLLTREDVDPARIACTGASGGGLNTLYVSAIDERIGVAAPVVYVTGFAEFLRTRADHCPCSHIPGLARFADIGDVAALIAPRPLLCMTARKDPQFTVAGARHAAAEARPAYRAYGREADLEVREFDSGHDYNREMREALYGFLLKHLKGKGDGSPVPEPEMALEEADSPVLRCFPEGRVPATAATVRDLARQEAVALRAALPAPKAASRKALAAVLNWPPEPVAPAVPEPLPSSAGPQGSEKLLLRTADGIALPALFYRGNKEGQRGPREGRPSEGTTVVVIGPGGLESLGRSPGVAGWRQAGWNVLLVDLRGWGETAGREHLLATDSLLLGEPLAAQRARDALAVAAYLRGRNDVYGPLVLLGQGVEGGLVALLAGALDRSPSPGGVGRGRKIGISMAAPDLPASLVDLYDAGVPADTTVWELLKVADIPHLKALGGKRWRNLEGIGHGPDHSLLTKEVGEVDSLPLSPPSQGRK